MRYIEIFWDEELGAGSEGNVYLGRLLDGNYCAVKVPPPEVHQLLMAEPFVRDRIRDRMSIECRRHVRIRGKRHVRLLGSGLQDGIPFMALELAERSLADEMKRFFDAHYVYHPSFALERIYDVLLAIAAAHQSKILHRDVKPANLLLFDDRVKLGDFGIARSLIRPLSLQTQTLVGTPRYAAPEQLRIARVGGPADVYAAGVILYEMLTGFVPDPDPVRLTRAFVPPASIYGHITESLQFLVNYMLDEHPNKRPTALDASRLVEAIWLEYEQLFAAGIL
jgi:eukaryotic-like serine/threonine-protein kinase